MMPDRWRRAAVVMLPLLLSLLLCAVAAEAIETTYIVRIVQRGHHSLYDAEAGKRFYIHALRPGYGERFDRWVSLVGDVYFENRHARETSFIMPARNVVIEARYEDDWDWDDHFIGIGGSGCATGAGGIVAMLAVALLLAHRAFKR